MSRESTNLKLTAVLFRALQSVDKLVRKDIATYQLNTSEFSALELLYNRGPQPMQTMAQRMLLANSSTTYVIDKLVERGYIKRHSDEGDKRKLMVDLTAEGRHFFDGIFNQHKQLLNSLYEVINDEEADLLIGLLKKIGYHAKEMEETK